MTYEEKIRWLRMYRQVLRAEDRLRDQIRAVRARMESTSQALRPVVGGGSGDGNVIERGVELLDRYQRDLVAQLETSQQIRAEIEEAIYALPDHLQREVLLARYIDGLPVWKTANRLYISESWVKETQRKAIENIKIVSASVPLDEVK